MQMKLAKPLHWISVAKQGGSELYQDVYGGINFYWELQDSIPEAKKNVEAFQKKFGIPPGDYGVYAYIAGVEVAPRSELAESPDAEKRAAPPPYRPQYNHIKGTAEPATL